MTHQELRQTFLDYFQRKGHAIVPSASLVPSDPAEANQTLFISAGMQQFKRYYSNVNEAPYATAASIQKCLRTTDIDLVGDDTHLSFLEMLGNFSFGYPSKEGSYFKEESIAYAWEFLTEVLKFDKSRLHATYFEGNHLVKEDSESKKILETYLEKGLTKIVPQGFEDNFWSLGTEDSPGGPTVEFYVDGIEVWNLVFNEYIFKNGKYEPAEFKGVDTGMGFERLLTTLQGHNNVYETELFQPIIKKLEEISGKKYAENAKEFRILGDHIKAAVFAINDGVVPSNKGAGYIVRRLIRRAIVKSQKLNISNNFTTEIAKEVFNIYSSVYKIDDQILLELEREEIKFRNTLAKGLKEFERIKDALDGEKAFDLYQTYGFPLEMTVELAKEQGIKVNHQEFAKAFSEHQEKSRTASAGLFKGGLADASEIVTKYHTATHLLHAALRQVLGDHVQQKGSNITPERLRFDFSHPEKMTPEQIQQVEDLVNEQIQKDLPVTMEEMSPEEAKQSGALGFFEHKYGDKVKVYSIDNFSKEICGGPHVEHTGALGHFKMSKEEASSAGVRRIKAVLE